MLQLFRTLGNSLAALKHSSENLSSILRAQSERQKKAEEREPGNEATFCEVTREASCRKSYTQFSSSTLGTPGICDQEKLV